MASRTRTGIRSTDVEFRPMSPDEIERTMQFLLRQQAQFTADSARNDARWAELRDELTEKTRQLTEGLFGLTSVIGTLAFSQLATDRQLQTVDRQLQTTEEHLNTLIQLFERHLPEDHGAQPS